MTGFNACQMQNTNYLACNSKIPLPPSALLYVRIQSHAVRRIGELRVPGRSLGKLFCLQALKLLKAHTTRLKLVCLLLASLFKLAVDLPARHGSYLLNFFVLSSSFHDCGHVIGEAQLYQGFGNVIAGNRFLGLFFRYLVCLRGDECDELHTALNQQIACLFGKCHTGRWWEDFADDLLDGGYLMFNFCW